MTVSVEAAMADDSLRQAAAVNPEDKFELVFRNLLDTLFVERMDQNEEIFVRFMNDLPFQKIVTAWMASVRPSIGSAVVPNACTMLLPVK